MCKFSIWILRNPLIHLRYCHIFGCWEVMAIWLNLIVSCLVQCCIILSDTWYRFALFPPFFHSMLIKGNKSVCLWMVSNVCYESLCVCIYFIQVRQNGGSFANRLRWGYVCIYGSFNPIWFSSLFYFFAHFKIV